MLNLKTNFERKTGKFELQDCIINKIVVLSPDEFENFTSNMLRDQDFIADSIDDMYTDENGVCHGLLVLGEDTDDGILIDSSGYSYGRYASFLPNIKPYVNSQISQICEAIVKDGTQNTSGGNWVTYFDEIQEHFGVSVSPNNGIGTMLMNALNNRDEIAELELNYDNFDITYYLDYCNNLEDEHQPQKSKHTKFADLLCCNFEDVHLVHNEIDNSPSTICKINSNTFTEEGKQEWADVLNANVCRIFNGSYGLQIELSDVKASRLDQLSNCLAGYCSQENHEKWFAESSISNSPELKME